MVPFEQITLAMLKPAGAAHGMAMPKESAWMTRHGKRD